jgi:hypothetical protein
MKVTGSILREIIQVKYLHNISEIGTRNIYRMERDFNYLRMNPDQRYIILGIYLA